MKKFEFYYVSGTTLTRECEELEKKKQLVASDFFPTPSEIEWFDKSEISEFAKYILKKAANDTDFKFRRTDFSLAQDYLTTCLIFDNASRPGAISNKKLANFACAIKKDNGYVISVPKQDSTKRSIPYSMHREIFNLLKLYVTHFRNKLEGISTSPQNTVFVLWNSSTMDSSLINLGLNLRLSGNVLSATVA